MVSIAAGLECIINKGSLDDYRHPIARLSPPTKGI